MNEQVTAAMEPPETAASATTASSERAERAPRRYPYYPLEHAVEVAQRIYGEGGGSVDKAQLAELLGKGKGSSALEMRIISAAMFGIVQRHEGKIETTDLGRRVARPMSPDERGNALSEAFDNVELFAAIRKRFAGQPLPDDNGIKVLMVRDLGLPNSQRNDAFNVMIRSAREAGILINRSSGMYLTALAGRPTEPSETERPLAQEKGGPNLSTVSAGQSASQALAGHLHPSIRGLVDELAREGETWDAERRGIWESAMRAILDYVYPNTRKRVQE